MMMYLIGSAIGVVLIALIWIKYYYFIEKTLNDPNNKGDDVLGMENCAIPASRITASSSADGGPAFFARLNGSKSWCAGSPADCFLEVDLSNTHSVSAVATQGNPIGNHDYVKKYKIQYSIDGMEWEFYKENYREVLEGNSDHCSPVKKTLDPPITTRYVRFWPTAWFQWPCLRVEIYGTLAPQDTMSENGVVSKLQLCPENKLEDVEIMNASHQGDQRNGELNETKHEKYYRQVGHNTFLDDIEEDANQEVMLDENQFHSSENEVQGKTETAWETQMEDSLEENSFELENEPSEMEGRNVEVDERNVEMNGRNVEMDEEEEKAGKLNGNEGSYGEIAKELFNNIKHYSIEEKTNIDIGDMELTTEMNTMNINSEIISHESDVKITTSDENSFHTLYTSTPVSTPVKPRRLYVNKPFDDTQQTPTIICDDVDLKRLMDVKERLESEVTTTSHGVELRKRKRIIINEGPPEFLHVPRRVHEAMWGDSPMNSISEGLNHIPEDDKPLIEMQDGGAPLAKHEDDHIEESSDHQTPQAVTIRTVKTVTTRIERHYGVNHEHHSLNHGHEDSGFGCSSHLSHESLLDSLLSQNGFYKPTPYAARASCEHLHPTDPVVQVAMESSFNERVDSMDQINIDALANKRFSGLDLLQSPYDAVSGEDIQRLLAWEDDTLPGWTRIKKSRDYEILKGKAVDGGPPIIKSIVTLKKISYEEAVRLITNWKVRQEWDKTFDKITVIEESYNFNVLHCSMKKQGLTLAVMDDVDIDEPYHASVWSTADHPDSYSLSSGRPLRYETMISGLVIRPKQDDSTSSTVTVVCQLKGSASSCLKGTYLTGNLDRWTDMMKKYSSSNKARVQKT